MFCVGLIVLFIAFILSGLKEDSHTISSIILVVGCLLSVFLISFGLYKTIENSSNQEVITISKEEIEITVEGFIDKEGLKEPIFVGEDKTHFLLNLEGFENEIDLKDLKQGEIGILTINTNVARYKDWFFTLGKIKEYSHVDTYEFRKVSD